MAYQYTIVEHILFGGFWQNSQKALPYFKDKTVLITGATFGIGEALTQLLAEAGGHLILVARTTEKLRQLQTTLSPKGATIDIYPTDLTKEEEVAQLLTQLQAYQQIDVLVSNAGKSIMRSIYDSLDRLHDFQRTMALNYFGPVQLLLGLLPQIEAAQGRIVNVSAVNTLLIPAPYWAAYQASKTAFDQWFRCVSAEVNVRGVGTSTVYLPLVRTRMIAPTKAYQKAPAMHPEHVAAIIVNTIVKQKRRYKPWWLGFGEWASLLFRPLWEWGTRWWIKQNK